VLGVGGVSVRVHDAVLGAGWGAARQARVGWPVAQGVARWAWLWRRVAAGAAAPGFARRGRARRSARFGSRGCAPGRGMARGRAARGAARWAGLGAVERQRAWEREHEGRERGMEESRLGERSRERRRLPGVATA
jgi:hypothetical protein